MSLLKRLSATVVSNMERVVSEVENHEAVAQATIKDMRHKVASAKVRLAQVRREQQRLEQEIERQTQDVERWRKRAVAVAEKDESRALECINRSRQCQTRLEKLQQNLQEYSQTARKLASDIANSEEKLAEMSQKLTMMKARESASSALNAVNWKADTTDHLLDETFERWEINISQSEMATASQPVMEDFEDEFLTQEREQELRLELQRLLNEEDEQ